MIKVAAAVIEKDGRVLVCKRPQGKNHGGLWEFPGGKAEQGETLSECIVRECREELGIELSAERNITAMENGGYMITFIACRILSGNIILNEHEDSRFVTAEDTESMDFCPCDRAALDAVFGKKKYPFRGADGTSGIVANGAYKGLTPCSLYDMLSHIWSADTCAPRLRDGWSKDDMTRGQCSVTAFLAQDVFGGEVYGIKRSDGYHCLNVVNGVRFDLTSEQFHGEVLNYDDVTLQSREVHFAKEEKRLRYELLKGRLEGAL